LKEMRRVRWSSSMLLFFRVCVALAWVAVLICFSCSNERTQRSTSRATPSPSSPDESYLRGIGGKLVDSKGHPVKMIGVSWFGFETSSCAVGGLSVRNWRDMLDQIRGGGFNVLRHPYSNQFLDDPTCVPSGIDYRKNPDLKGLKGLALMDRIVDEAGRQGLKVILDRHAPTPDARTGDLWYTDQVPESRWIEDWVMLA